MFITVRDGLFESSETEICTKLPTILGVPKLGLRCENSIDL